MRYAHPSQSYELAAVERLCKTGEGNEKETDSATGHRRKIEAGKGSLKMDVKTTRYNSY